MIIENNRKKLLESYDFNIAASKFPIILFGEQQKILLVNKKAEELFDIYEQDVLEKNFFEEFTNLLNKDNTAVELPDRAELSDNYIAFNAIFKGNGEVIYCDWLLLSSIDINNRNTLCIGIDHSNIKKLEKDLEERDSIIYELMDKVRSIHYRTNIDGIIESMSDSISDIYEGLKPEDFIGRNINELYKNPEDRKDMLKEIAKNGFVSDYVVNLVNPDGCDVFVNVSAFKVYNDNGEYVGIEGVSRDVTTSKSAEIMLEKNHERLERLVEEQTKELREAKEKAEQSNRAKSAFLASISHEIRTPLHGILSFAELGVNRSDSLDKEKVEKYFSTIHKSGKRLLTLLNDLLDFAKMEAGKMEYSFTKTNLFKLFEVVADEFTGMLNDKNIELVVEKPLILPDALIDGARISQVYANLMSNAVKFCDKDSKIGIFFEESEIAFSGKKSVPAIKFSIKDQGIGIEKSELESVFDKFSQCVDGQKKYSGGTGLGLAISKEIITAHNGIIYAENNKEGGATFSFIVPRIPDIF